ncbi:hypothetical protein B0H13DRAFT_1877408 [Mycena leptocephala]|nr:hypothetical protein B0H13DRAFT_1877408 [Mycena leptocephala]
MNPRSWHLPAVGPAGKKNDTVDTAYVYRNLTHLELLDDRRRPVPEAPALAIALYARLGRMRASGGSRASRILPSTRCIVFLTTTPVTMGVESPLLADDRFVAVEQRGDYRADWVRGVHTGDDYWAVADAVVAARRAGKVDRTWYPIRDTGEGLRVVTGVFWEARDTLGSGYGPPKRTLFTESNGPSADGVPFRQGFIIAAVLFGVISNCLVLRVATVADGPQSRNKIHKRSIHSEVFITVEDDAMKLEARFVVFVWELALGTHMLNQEFHGWIWGGRGDLDGGPFRSSSFMKRIPPNYKSDILRGERQRRGTTPKALSDMNVGVEETFRSGRDNK